MVPFDGLRLRAKGSRRAGTLRIYPLIPHQWIVEWDGVDYWDCQSIPFDWIAGKTEAWFDFPIEATAATPPKEAPASARSILLRRREREGVPPCTGFGK